MSYSVISIDEHGKTLLWFVHTKDNHRKKGYAVKMMKYLQERYFVISTGVDGSKAGNKLMKKMGFIKQGEALVWTHPKLVKKVKEEMNVELQKAEVEKKVPVPEKKQGRS